MSGVITEHFISNASFTRDQGDTLVQENFRANIPAAPWSPPPAPHGRSSPSPPSPVNSSSSSSSAAPSLVSELRAEKIEEKSVTLVWREPSYPNSSRTEYEVKYYEKVKSCRTFLVPSRTFGSMHLPVRRLKNDSNRCALNSALQREKQKYTNRQDMKL